MKPTLKSLIVFSIAALAVGCADVEQDKSPEGELSVTTANLKSVEAEYVPESISDTGTATMTNSARIQSNDDICAGVDFIKCQPRLIRAYLIYGRATVGITHAIIVSVARQLSQAADNSSGVYHDEAKNLTVEFKKRSLLDFDLLIVQNGIPVGRVSANPALYNIQFNLNVLDKDKPDSRGGMLDMQVKFTDHGHWQSQLTITGAKCNVQKPDDPENGQITVTRNGEMWAAQSMFYNGIAATFGSAKSCDQPASDSTGMVLYTDIVADHVAAKGALYVMKRTETSTAQLENFGFSGLCSNYADWCSSIAIALGTNTTSLNTYLGTLANPYCVRRGSPDVTFNSDCAALSPAVASTPFLPNTNWISANDFSKLQVVIPDHL